MTGFHHRIGHEIELIYRQLVALPPLAFILLSCLALILAATIAFGLHL